MNSCSLLPIAGAVRAILLPKMQVRAKCSVIRKSSFVFFPCPRFNYSSFFRPRNPEIDYFAHPRYLPWSNHCRLGKIRNRLLFIKGHTPALTRSVFIPPDLTRRRTCKPTLGLIARNPKPISYSHFPMSSSDYFARVKGAESHRPAHSLCRNWKSPN